MRSASGAVLAAAPRQLGWQFSLSFRPRSGCLKVCSRLQPAGPSARQQRRAGQRRHAAFESSAVGRTRAAKAALHSLTGVRVSRVSRVCPGSPRCLFTGTRSKLEQASEPSGLPCGSEDGEARPLLGNVTVLIPLS